MAMRHRFAMVLGALVLALLFSGCVGPMWSTADIMAAENALEQAKAADAEQLAPYEYHMAQEMLRKAQEEWGYADYGMSREFAEKAKESAEKARAKASTEPWNGPPTSAIAQ